MSESTSAGSAGSVKRGIQKADARAGLGNAIAFIGVAIGIVIGFAAGSFWYGFAVVATSTVAGLAIRYG